MFRFAFVFLFALLAASCMPSGQPVKGIAETSDWFSLPLDRALEEGRTRPEAISACNTAECPQKIAVAFMTAQGREADRLELLLKRPSAFLEEMQRRRYIAQRRRNRSGTIPSPSNVAIASLLHDGLSGFSVTMNRQDNGSHAVAGAVLGWRNGQTLSFVIGVGENKDMVAAAVMKAADYYRKNSD